MSGESVYGLFSLTRSERQQSCIRNPNQCNCRRIVSIGNPIYEYADYDQAPNRSRRKHSERILTLQFVESQERSQKKRQEEGQAQNADTKILRNIFAVRREVFVSSRCAVEADVAAPHGLPKDYRGNGLGVV